MRYLNPQSETLMSCTVLFSLFVFPFISCFCFSIRFQLFWALEAVTILKTASMLVSRAQTNQHYKCGDDTQQCARCTIQLKTFLSLTASLAATLMDWAFSLSLSLSDIDILSIGLHTASDPSSSSCFSFLFCLVLVRANAVNTHKKKAAQ